MYRDTFTGETLTEHDLEERYADALDDAYGPVAIAGCQYETSRALRLLDPISFRCGALDWVDAEIRDGNLTEL